MPQLTKLIDVRDFEDPDLLPHLRTAAGFDGAAFGVENPMISLDDGHWRTAMSLLAFARAGVTGRRGALIAGIGAGVDALAFLLARQQGVVLAADRYLECTPQSSRAPADMMLAPQGYSDLPYPLGGVIPVHTDPRALNLPGGLFDAAYAHGVFEFLGGDEDVAAAAEQLGRILKPGGTATITTEFLLAAPEGVSWPHRGWRAFTSAEIEAKIVAPSGLTLAEGPYDLRPSDETFAGKRILMDYTEENGNFDAVLAARDLRPNLVVYHQGFLICSVHLTLQKPEVSGRGAPPASAAGPVRQEVAQNARHAATVIARALHAEHRNLAPMADFPAAPQQELERLKASRSWRYTAPLRSLAKQMRAPSALRALVAGVYGVLKNRGRRD